MNEPGERGSLEGPPPDMQPQTGAKRPSPPPAPGGSQAPAGAGFDFNQPTIVSLLYLVSFLTGGLTAIIGVVLAYIWRSQPQAEWEVSHYQYLINTFWIAFIGFFVGLVLMIVLIGFLVLMAVMVLVILRSLLSLLNAQKGLPMPNPGTLLA